MERRLHAALAFVVVGVVACGARTTLFDESSENLSGDAGDFTDDGGRTRDSGTSSDAAAHDGAAVDAGFDAGPILCAFTTPTVLANLGNDETDEIMVDDSYVYFHDYEGLSRVAKSGGPVTLLATMKAPAWPDLAAFALSDTDVTWWQIVNGAMKTEVNHVPKGGGASTTVATLGDYFFYGSGGPTGSSYLWTSKVANQVLDSVAASGTVTQVGTTLPLETAEVAYNDGELYAFGPNGIFRFDGTTFQHFADVPSPNTYPNDMVFDDATIFLTANDEIGGFSVSSIPKTGGSFTTLMRVTQSYIGGIAVDADHVWVANRVPLGGTPSELLRMNKDGTDLTGFATAAASQIVGIAVDDLCVYWTETANSGVTPSRVVAAPK